MKNHRPKATALLLASIAALLLLTPGEAFASQEPLTAAVLDFQTSGERMENRGEEVAVLLNVDLGNSEQLFLVERQQLADIFSEQELGLAGNVTAQTAAKVGQLTGAKILISGRIFQTGSKYFVVGRAMSTETGRVFSEQVSFEKIEAMEPAVAELGGKLRAAIDKNATAFTAKTETFEEKLARMQEIVKGKTLPSVSVQVEEEHIRMEVIDPAVETEMKKVLLALGFEVINPATSTKPADIVIKGEAFSETAGRRGGLVSCRSRVEIEATQTSDGKLLIADRQNSVAVDVAEAIAGKRALENAALMLTERILPQLAGQ